MLGRTSGIILQKEGLTIMKAIEIQSTKENFDHGHLFEPITQNFDKLKIAHDIALDQIWELIDYGIVTQIFDLRLDEVNNELYIRPFLVSNQEGLFTLEESFHKLLSKSVSKIKKYIIDKKPLTEELWRLILIKISDPEYLKNFGEQDELDRWLDLKKFPFPPSKEMVNSARNLITEELNRDPKLMILPKIGFYSFLDSQAFNFLQISMEIFLAKIEPLLKNLDLALKDRLDEFSRLEKESLASNNGNEIISIQKRLEIYLPFEKLMNEKGYDLYLSVLNKLSKVAEKTIEAEKKQEIEKLLLVYLKMLESTFDFDSRLLRLNLEKEDENLQIIIEQLKKNPNVLSAEWHDDTTKIIVFSLKNIQSLKDINKLIYENHRFTTEYILYFKSLIEFNEPDIKPIFQDEEFVKFYGRNLQAVYFNYIPWFYKFFYYIGITPIVNIGYAKAKSIIAYSQMDRQFKYNKRRETYFKKKIREREERLEKEKKFQHKRILIQAIEEAFFTKKTLPTMEWICANYPIFSMSVIEKMIPDFAFQKFPNRDFTDSTILTFPNSPEFELRNQKLKDLLNLWIRGDEPFPKDLMPRLTEIRANI